MGSDQKTPLIRPRKKTRPTAQCPHCKEMIEVTVAGLFAMHPAVRRWNQKMCRGSGARARQRRT